MKELGALAVLGVREQPNLAQNLVTHKHWWKNIFRAITLPLWRVFGQNLAIFAHFWAFSVTFLVVTAINMLTLGTGRTCIILRHIPSWFEAVLAIAILQSCAQRGPKWPFWGQKWPNMAGLPMSQSGLRGPKMIPNDQYNMFLTIWGHFGTIWTLFDHFTQNLIFCLESTKCFLAKVILGRGGSWGEDGLSPSTTGTLASQWRRRRDADSIRWRVRRSTWWRKMCWPPRSQKKQKSNWKPKLCRGLVQCSWKE